MFKHRRTDDWTKNFETISAYLQISKSRQAKGLTHFALTSPFSIVHRQSKILSESQQMRLQRETHGKRPPPPKMCAHLGLITSNLYLPAGGTLLEDRPQSRSAIIRGGGEVGEREAARKEAQPSQR